MLRAMMILSSVASLDDWYHYYFGESNQCRASSDGDCFWESCPQLRDNEPETSHRHCPLDVDSEEV